MTAAHDAVRDHWDLFCRVVDNFGDIGIAWRLARQLNADGRRCVRLIVDGLASFAVIEPRVDRHRSMQTIDGLVVVGWDAIDETIVADVVIEVLGCGLPARYLDAMACRADRKPAWIDFEHLSAERWVDDFHGLPSPHPSLPLVKYFFYPGFGPRTGGLLLEPGLARRRDAFVEAPAEVAALWRRLGVDAPRPGERRLSLFVYDHAPADALAAALSRRVDERWSVVVPRQGTTAASLGDRRVPFLAIPFVDQDEYDRLLWACDVAFVRGEDSFVRAQAAGRPLVWQIYRQADRVHLAKLAAFEDRYEEGLAPVVRGAQRRLWSAWNDEPADLAAALDDWLDALPALRSHAEAWRSRLAAQPPAVERLVAFVAALRPRGLLD